MTYAGRRFAGLILILVMALGSVVMWLGIPIGLIYAASRVSESGDPNMGVYVGLAVAIPALMFTMAKILGRIDRLYAEVMGTADDRPVRANWMRSMRAERGSQHRTTVLDVVMIISVGLALLLMAAWFLLFAGSSLPS
ncbi:MAG TPA: hypothetical protein VGI54_07535 [Solirubrobacteraceae bacterium]|jgi:hypothetical protein